MKLENKKNIQIDTKQELHKLNIIIIQKVLLNFQGSLQFFLIKLQRNI